VRPRVEFEPVCSSFLGANCKAIECAHVSSSVSRSLPSVSSGKPSALSARTWASAASSLTKALSPLGSLLGARLCALLVLNRRLTCEWLLVATFSIRPLIYLMKRPQNFASQYILPVCSSFLGANCKAIECAHVSSSVSRSLPSVSSDRPLIQSSCHLSINAVIIGIWLRRAGGSHTGRARRRTRHRAS